MIVYNLTHICVNLLRTVVFVVTLTIFTFITRSNLCSDSNPISDLYVFDLRAYSYCRTNNLMPFQTVLTFVWYRISRTRYPATRGASKAPHPEVRVWTSEPQTLRSVSGWSECRKILYYPQWVIAISISVSSQFFEGNSITVSSFHFFASDSNIGIMIKFGGYTQVLTRNCVSLKLLLCNHFLEILMVEGWTMLSKLHFISLWAPGRIWMSISVT